MINDEMKSYLDIQLSVWTMLQTGMPVTNLDGEQYRGLLIPKVLCLNRLLLQHFGSTVAH